MTDLPPFRLAVFGPPRLERTGATVSSSGPRRLALLAVVAASGPGGITRDRVLGLLWPDTDQDRARHSLNQTLYSLRRDSQADLLVGISDLRLDPAACSADVVAFDAAILAGQPAAALAVYAGPLMDGFFLADTPDFQHWLDGERDRRARQAGAAAQSVAMAAEGEAVAAAWRRAAELDPFSGRIARQLMEALVAAGDRTGALRHAERHAAFLARELETAPVAAVIALADELRRAVASAAPRVAPASGADSGRTATIGAVDIAAPSVAPDMPDAPNVPDASPLPHAPALPDRRSVLPVSWRRRPMAWAAAAGAALLAVVLLKRPAVAYAEGEYFVLGDFVNLTTDTLLTRMTGTAFSTAVSQSSRLAPLPRPRITASLQRMQRADTTYLLGPELAREVATRENVPLVVTGDIMEAGSQLQLTTHLIESATGRELRTRTRRIAGRTELLTALDALAADLRRDLGEARSTVTQAVPLPQLTTRSLEALGHWANAQQFYRLNKSDAAADELRAAIAADSTFAQAKSSYGAHLVRMNQPREADAHFTVALREAAQLPPSERLLIEAQVANARGNSESAIRAVSSYLALHPQDVGAWTRLGGYLLRAHQLRAALAAFDSAGRRLPLRPGDHLDIAAIWSDLARVGTNLAAFDSSRAQYEQAFAGDSTFIVTYFYNQQYGDVLIALGRPDSARAVFGRMLTRNADDRARGLRSLGFLAAREGRWRSASRRFAEAAMISTSEQNWTSAMRNEALTGAVLALGGRRAEGLPALRRAAALARTHDVEARMTLFVVTGLEQAGDHAGAAALARWMRAGLLPGNTTAARAMTHAAGVVLVGDQRYPAALDSLTAAFYADSGSYQLAALAAGLAARGDLDAASARYATLARDFAHGTEGQFASQLAPYWIARHHEERGRRPEAIAAYAAFLRRFPLSIPADEVPLAVPDARERLATLRQEPGRF